MPRKAATIEYLERLVEFAGGKKKFCHVTGMKNSNLSAYLNGKIPITWKLLHKYNAKMFGKLPAFLPVVEGYDLKEKGLPIVSVVPREPGLYALYDSSMRLIYFGKAKSLFTEVRQALRRPVKQVKPWTKAEKLTFRDITVYLSAYTIPRGDDTFRHDLEVLALSLFANNTFNKNKGEFKRTE